MNPYSKYLKPEDHLHIQVMGYIKLQYPKAIPHHSPNEGKRTKFEQYLLKMLGVSSGFPDIFIPEPRGTRCGLFVELKAGKNKPTENQTKWLNYLSKNNYYAVVCYSFDEARGIIDTYMNGKINN